MGTQETPGPLYSWKLEEKAISHDSTALLLGADGFLTRLPGLDYHNAFKKAYPNQWVFYCVWYARTSVIIYFVGDEAAVLERLSKIPLRREDDQTGL